MRKFAKARSFINEQKFYFWMLVFIILATSMQIYLQQFYPAPHPERAGQKAVIKEELPMQEQQLERSVNKILQSKPVLGILLLTVSLSALLLFIGGNMREKRPLSPSTPANNHAQLQFRPNHLVDN